MKFLWKGLTKGDFSNGTIDALNEAEAIFLLKQQGVVVFEIFGEPEVKKEVAIEKANIAKDFKNKVKLKDKDLLLFTRKLSAMLGAGLAVVPALEMLRDQAETKALKSLLSEIVNDVNAGIPISTCLANYPDTFDSIYINLIKAGESSGSLDGFLKKICFNMEKRIKIVKQLKSALTYPIVLMTVAILVIGVMLTYVVPVFAEMYAGSGAALPKPTQIVMSISEFIRSIFFVLILISLLLVFILIKRKMSTDIKFKTQVHQRLLRLPVFGELISNSTIARFSNVLSNLVSSGVTLLEALEISKSSISNEYIKEGVESLKRNIYSGKSFEEVLKNDPRFPATFKSFVSVGERTGKLNDMLMSISTFYEDEFDGSVDKLSQLLEPAMILFLGVTIGFILIAMYMPIFNMGQTM
jgi:type IV pilus assembly protein PilC